MTTPTEAGRDYWRTVLTSGGSTAIPRWTLDPVPGEGESSTPIPEGLDAELGAPLHTVLLAAHAKVLAALSGESEVIAGYLADPDGAPLPCRLSTAPVTWRELLAGTSRSASELLSHQDFPVDHLRAELGMTERSFETVLDPSGRCALADGVVLAVGVSSDHVLRVRYRTEAIDAECAERIVGYHLTALHLIAADPDAEHDAQSLLSPGELYCQLEELAGPRRAMPDLRVHELFEKQVRARPDAVAAQHAGRQWTYRELNARANRLARALLASGLHREDVVAVVTERNLDWLAAVLAVFKAGGAYLPIEPHFPADRIATTLSRAGCHLVLTEEGSTATLDQALDTLSGVRQLFVGAAYAEGHAADNPGVSVASDQLAYIYFTSGSTGEPKGAMCEHAGMVNHLYAKIGDLDITEGQVVAQTAPQCFDISLWQLVAALLVGGRTLLVEQDVILDVERFVDTIVDNRVCVLQVVPSYLEVVLSYVEQNPRELADLRYVSVTGEALKRELAHRWFAAAPKIKLVNAYGLTETSDDTNHEVMDAPPDGDRVPLGRPVNNVQVRVVDERLSPVPLGAPGAIVFAGVCVGRGYVNDPERTAQAYLVDPDHSGGRLYRGGDFGRWLPDGKLDYLGRRDSQVKISGFRIEIGEIENTLLRVPGVRDGAVVVAESPDRGKRLVAVYSGAAQLPVEALRDRLGRSLPAYMVPAAFHWREQLPLTANGKIDRKRLTALAQELDTVDEVGEAPATATERRLAAAWATVLGVPADRIGRRDHFFDRGGTSLSAVKLAIALRRAVSLKDVTRYPVLADLADVVDGRASRRTGLLQSLTESDSGTALVCFPHAGGNAVNFQPLAAALRDSGLAVYAVELPGHDLAAEREPFAPLPDVVDRVAAEVTELRPRRILLWGHSSGAAFALATALRLAELDVDVAHVFLAAQLPGDAAERRTAAAALTDRTDAEIASTLADDVVDVGHAAAAYRHDCVSAHHYLADALDHPPTTTLAAPVTVVVAADDPITADAPDRHRDWRRLAGHVTLHQLTDGGHHFPRTRPMEAAAAVLHAVNSERTDP